MNEQILSFGPGGQLHGIFTEAQNDTNKPCVIIVNAGAVHKAGPFNLHVHLARFLAKNGYNSFRFDLSGQGDSSKIASNISRSDQILEDMKEALNHLEQKFHFASFVAFGLCTGAENAHKIAVNDKRISGLIWVDGYGYYTPKFKRVKILKKLARPAGVLRFVLRKLIPKTNKAASPVKEIGNPDNQSNDDFVWRLPPIGDYKQDMKTLEKRNTSCLYIYSGGVHSYYNYQGQMADAFSNESFTSIFEERYFPKADHTFSLIGDKRALFKSMKQWLSKHY